jgi:hypothetical protein
MRLFYKFAEAGTTVTDPQTFQAAPRVSRFYPNFVQLDFVPVEGIDTVAEYWVPDSHILAGRLTFVNRTDFPRHLELELCAVLAPLDGKSLAATRHQLVNVLAGRTSDLQPVIFMTGGRPPSRACPRIGFRSRTNAHRALGLRRRSRLSGFL